jgi:lipopolysaccharide export system protein LptA
LAGKTGILIKKSKVKSQKSKFAVRFIVAVAIAIVLTFPTQAQKKADTAKKMPIEIMPGTGVLQFVQTDSGGLNKLIGNVILKQGETMMYCDSAYFFLEKNSLEAFGNVKVIQPGSQAQSDYMRYLGNQKLAYMKGNVMLTDGKSNLWSEEVEYNVGTKIGTYSNGGTLQDSTTTLSSNSGIYNMKDKNARFTGEVIVTDPEYNIISDDMGYNTETKFTTFFGKSTVTSDKSVLKTSCGTYDSKNKISHFPCRASVINEGQFIDADSMYYNRRIGKGIAVGHVVSIDTEQHTTLYSGRADYNDKKRVVLASIKPVMKQMNGKDSLFIRADTFFSAPVPKKGDTAKKVVLVTKKEKRKKQKEVIVESSEDTTSADSTGPRYFIGYHHVLIFSDSMQGKCDSISYSDKDSVMRMMYDPITWSRKSQITGDTILMYMDSSKVKRVYVPNNALVVSQSGPPKARLFDQIQGKTLTAHFKDNAIDNMVVRPNAEAIYYAKDEHEAYIGVNEASSERMRIFFKDEALNTILFEKDVKQKLTPLDKADLPGMKLSRFKWLDDKRPKSLEELFK